MKQSPKNDNTQSHNMHENRNGAKTGEIINPTFLLYEESMRTTKLFKILQPAAGRGGARDGRTFLINNNNKIIVDRAG